ncbi:sugar transferase [Polaribacter aquimarinus]|uniref:Sugar transferase n=1 Tax=Polaribacter aquimarinus TaxID=2100726 RepID=A0A2U2JAW3_9FLAO|nr:sugar transferase [Polaribacter aquimarinus]PWG05473.1 sugar transferase [Polaribacter aquimarinus]
MEETNTIEKEKKEKDLSELIFLNALKSCSNEKAVKELILKEVSNNILVINYIEKYLNISQEETFITATSTRFNIDSLKENSISGIVNLKKINDVRYVNKFFEAVNKKLPNSGVFFGCVETYPDRKQAIMEKFPIVINWFVYFFDTLFTRVFPKLKITKKIYFYLTKGKGRVISRAETYGRLYSCGFEILDEKTIDNTLYFVAKKVKDPVYDTDPTYGPIIRLKRVGKGKKKFNVYKLRTMHPFSEYLQEYVYNQNKLQEGGKIKDDFRISPEGRIFRKFWIDEIPMIINILKGDMKLVGVRPLSAHFFSLYDENLQDLRTQFKPGFIPPFYADLPKTMEEIMASEKKYLEAYSKSPLKTDLRYIYMSFKNVLFKGARSN